MYERRRIMPFTNPNFPGQIFNTIDEFLEARKKRAEVEERIAEKVDEITKVTATVMPASKNMLERKVAELERKLEALEGKLCNEPSSNKEGLQIGAVLRGESRGKEYTLEVLEEGYLCSDGNIYDSLSGAALGVSGNRRSGWKFWRDVAGTSVGEATGRFKKNGCNNPFDS
jgi:hypothetical protein